MKVTELLRRRYTPAFGGNAVSDDPFVVVYKPPSRGSMLELDRDPARNTARKASEALQRLIKARADGDDDAALEASKSIDPAVVDAEADAAAERARAWVRRHIIKIDGLVLDDEGRELAGLADDADAVDFVLEQPSLVTELLHEIRSAGFLASDQGKG